MNDETSAPAGFTYDPNAPVPPGQKCAEEACPNQMWPADAPGLPRFCPDHNEQNP